MKIKVITYVLALIFLLSGGAKVAGLEFEIVAFERWGYPLWFMYFTGVAEVAIGIGLSANILRKYAAMASCPIMLGAIGTHAINSEWPMFAIAFTIFLLCVTLALSLWRPTSVENNAG
ncbi:DoxX family protein [Aliikangiella coralliicola]|uniref:DoxX family protein n=1 Tax=Aliikangiella coralliicola TaxID=2592383 RepID=A0A545TWD6_9GAMM|nr:DoxX family protein [Aliikangiella coralliicola]TQV81533.1 DoxX family protein [Aliikangiella coralliicola]